MLSAMAYKNGTDGERGHHVQKQRASSKNSKHTLNSQMNALFWLSNASKLNAKGKPQIQ